MAGCSLKSSVKNMTVLSLGDTKAAALDRWGKPDEIKTSSGPWGDGEYWMYECLKFPDCDESDCFFSAPCYYLYFEDGELISIYDTTDL